MRAPLPKRRSVRLGAANYVGGMYLVTIVTDKRKMAFGRVSDGEVRLSPLGVIVDDEWRALPDRRPAVTLVEHIVMPNHFHAVVKIESPLDVVKLSDVSINPDSLSSAVGGFKAGVVRVARGRQLIGERARVWQRGFHESVLDTEREFVDACAYVRRNPLLWRWDPIRNDP